MSLLVDVSDTKLSAIAAIISASTATCVVLFLDSQMYCDAPPSQVIYPQYATDHISPQIVED